MKYISGSIDSLIATIKNMARPVVTESIRPEASRAERYRASFALTHDANGEQNCIGCKLCENICPSAVITVVAGAKRVSEFTGKKRGFADDFTVDLQACIYCELCVSVCPTDSIVMVRVQEQPGFDREDLVLTQDKLYANETSKPLAWANGTKLRAMLDPNASPEEDAS